MNQRGFAPILIILAVIALLGIGGYYVTTKKAEAPTIQTNTPTPTPSEIQNETANWKTYAVEPGPTKKFEIKYPSGWDVSELSFFCKDGNARVAAVLSPTRTDLPGFKKISAAYLVQYCVSNSQTVLAYQGFIKAPLSAQPKESDKISLGDSDLKNTAEYEIAQKIIASVSTQAQSNSPQGQNEMANLKTFENKLFGISVSFPKEFVTEDGKDDFVFKNASDKTTKTNAEYFYFCDGQYMSSTGKVCSGPYGRFGVQISDYVVNQALIDSWAGEVARSQQVTVNGKLAWVIESCAGSGCNSSIMFNIGGKTLSMSFYNNLYDSSKSPLLISNRANVILDSLQFTQKDETASWNTCTNSKYNYEVKYPTDWKIWTSGAGEALQLTTCEVGLQSIIFSPNIYSDSRTPHVTLVVLNYAGVTSIDDYFQRNPEVLKARPKINETIIDGEKLVWLQDRTMLVFYKGSLFEFRGNNISDTILNNFFSSFKFTK